MQNAKPFNKIAVKLHINKCGNALGTTGEAANTIDMHHTAMQKPY